MISRRRPPISNGVMGPSRLGWWETRPRAACREACKPRLMATMSPGPTSTRNLAMAGLATRTWKTRREARVATKRSWGAQKKYSSKRAIPERKKHPAANGAETHRAPGWESDGKATGSKATPESKVARTRAWKEIPGRGTAAMTSSWRVAAREHAGEPGRRPSSGVGERWMGGGWWVAPAGGEAVRAEWSEGICPAARPQERSPDKSPGESPGESRELPPIYQLPRSRPVL